MILAVKLNLAYNLLFASLYVLPKTYSFSLGYEIYIYVLRNCIIANFGHIYVKLTELSSIEVWVVVGGTGRS